MVAAISEAMAPRQDGKYRGLSGGKLHHERSQNFVRLLAKSLPDSYPDPANVVAMSKGIGGNRLHYGMNELLFDIVVFEWDTATSAGNKKDLPFVKKGLLIVESEMAENSRMALYDFNKLVLGNAKRKLFIAPLVARGEAYRKTLASAARHCDGQLQLVMVPHPRDWAVFNPELVQLWDWDCEQWRRVG